MTFLTLSPCVLSWRLSFWRWPQLVLVNLLVLPLQPGLFCSILSFASLSTLIGHERVQVNSPPRLPHHYEKTPDYIVLLFVCFFTQKEICFHHCTVSYQGILDSPTLLYHDFILINCIRTNLISNTWPHFEVLGRRWIWGTLSVMVSFLCVTWTKPCCSDMWSSITLDVSVRVFSDDMNI